MIDIRQLERASSAYYDGNPIMTDLEFDTAIAQLRKNEPDHPFLKLVGAPVPGTLKAKHDIPMGSLANANNENEFRKWIPERRRICLSHKLDGSSLELVYENGHFVQAITRGDGKVGENVTRNVVLSPHFPKEIDPAITSVRCECLIHKDDWEKYFEGDANPRNSAAGTLRRHNGKNAEHLQLYAFNALINLGEDEHFTIIEANDSEYEILELLSEWFLTPEYFSSSNIEQLVEWYKKEEINRDGFIYEIDGIVAKIDDRVVSQKMGIRDGRPKGQVAIKFKPRGAETVLRKVVWQVGHTGALTPVGEVDPVAVGGTTIRRVTLCNMNEIERLGVAIGDIIEIVRAGDVIPQLSKRIKKSKERKIIYRPFQCPECRGDTERDGAKLFCINDKCPGKSFACVMTWIKKRNILNVGEGIIKAAGVEYIFQLYNKSFDEWSNVEVGNGTLGKKRAKKVIDALENSRWVYLSEFLGSIGIKGMGRSLCHILCDGLGLKSLDSIFVVKPEEIESLEGFGSARAHDFCNWILDHNEEILDLAHQMTFKNQPDTEGGCGVFDGETICFTGKSPKPRTEMSKLAEAAGASVSSSVNSNTTILVIADTNSTSSKAIKARKLGIRLMSPEDFLEKV